MIQGLSGSPLFWPALIVALAVVYLLPTLIAVIRGTDRLALVFLVNLIGAPSGIGWFAAMILAFGPRRLPPAAPLPWQPRPEPMQWPAGTWDAWQQKEEAKPGA